LNTQTNRGGLQTIVVGYKGVDDATAFMKRHNLPQGYVHATPSDLHVRIRGTPTILLVGRDARIVETWVGQLTSVEESALIAKLLDATPN
jgi:hypothetical protein